MCSTTGLVNTGCPHRLPELHNNNYISNPPPTNSHAHIRTLAFTLQLFGETAHRQYRQQGAAAREAWTRICDGAGTFSNPMSTARSRKQRRHIIRWYLRMRPWCALHTRLRTQAESAGEMVGTRERTTNWGALGLVLTTCGSPFRTCEGGSIEGLSW